MYYAIISDNRLCKAVEFKVKDYEDLTRQLIEYTIERLKNENEIIDSNDVNLSGSYIEREQEYSGISFFPLDMLVACIEVNNRTIKRGYYFKILTEKQYVESKL